MDRKKLNRSDGRSEWKSLEGVTLDKRFRVLERVGQGGMSEVYKAEHIMLQKMVAIKVLHKQQEIEGIERFQQEAKAISALDHRNIVKVYAFGASEDDQLYLAMDFLEGKSLSEILEDEQRLDWKRALSYALQIAQALEQAHSRGIVHRDLKPSNIIIEKDEYKNDIVKVVDFGIAKLTAESGKEVKDLTQDGNTCGSPPYMSPEQCMGERADARSDIYSFGIMLYELLSGIRPISGRTALELMTNHMERVPEFFVQVCPEAHVPDSLEAIARKCLEKAKEDRYQSMTEIQKDLELVGSSSDEELSLEDTNRKASEVSLATSRQKWLVKVIAAALAVIVACIAIGVALAFYLPRKNIDDMKSKVFEINLTDKDFSHKLDEALPPLLSAYKANDDKASQISIVRKLRKQLEALPPSMEKWLALSHLSTYLPKVGLDQDVDPLQKRILSGMQQLAAAAEQQGQADRAEEAYKQWLKLATQYEQSRTYILLIHHVLAAHYMNRNNVARAEHICRNAVRISEGAPEREQCSTYMSLGNVLMVAGRYAEAEGAFRESLKHCLSFQGPDGDLTRNLTDLLSRSLRAQNKNAEAQKVLSRK